MARRRNDINTPGGPYDAALADFAKRFRDYLAEKNWNQTEFEKAATRAMPGKQRFGKDNTSNYYHGRVFPGPVRFRAMLTALGKNPEDFPTMKGVAPVIDERLPPFEMKAMADGNVWLRMNRAVTMETAVKIMALLEEKK